MKNKKILWISLIVADVGITGFLFVISILMLVNVSKIQSEADKQDVPGLIGILIRDTNLYLWAFVVPLFVILAANIIALVLYVRKTTKKEPVKVNDLSAEHKEALRQELLRDLTGGAKPEEKPDETEEKKE